ncbi:MAG TPA: hypothetical protein VKB65_04235 [Myxococcota bacterium]|nr:hypothetical protein [Myxococcota bacterium]
MSIRTLALALVAMAVAGPSGADEPRVQEIHYETPGAVPTLSPLWQLEPAVSVLLTDDRLSPRRVVVRAGETVRWRSMARHASRIVFEREVARSMVCHSLVNFEIDGDSLRSGALHTGDTSSFCRLEPGTYPYRVERTGPAERPTAGGRQMSSRLEGVIVVLAAEPAPGAATPGPMAAR